MKRIITAVTLLCMIPIAAMAQYGNYNPADDYARQNEILNAQARADEARRQADQYREQAEQQQRQIQQQQYEMQRALPNYPYSPQGGNFHGNGLLR